MSHTAIYPTHWFGRKYNKDKKSHYDLSEAKCFEIFKGILLNGFKLNKCKEVTSILPQMASNLKVSESLTFKNNIVSFTDIPFSLSYEHRCKYGSWGIGMCRDWLIENRGQPVIYRSYDMSDSLVQRMLLLFRVLYPGEDKELKSFSEQLGDSPEMVSLKGLLMQVTGEFFFSSKHLDHEHGQKLGNYLEREWRITWEPPMNDPVKFEPSDIKCLYYFGGDDTETLIKGDSELNLLFDKGWPELVRCTD